MLRGGFAILYETLLQASTVQQIENNPPFSASAITNAPLPFPTDNSPALTLLDLRGSAQPSNSIAAIPANLRTPYSMQWSFGVQQALGENWLVEVGYRATRGVHLPFDYNIDQAPLDAFTPGQRQEIANAITAPLGTAPVIDALRPYPGFHSIDFFDNAANSIYGSLQTKLERRFRSGLNLLAAYTWSKSIDDATDFASSDASEQVLDSRNRHLQRALSSFDVPHRFTAAFNYQLPAPGRVWLLRGWQINGNITLQSGQPFTPYNSQFDPYRNESYNRLNVIGNPFSDVPLGYAYNPAAFALPPIGTFGNSGRNVIRGDKFRTVDLSLFRTLILREFLRLQLRLEAQNSLNQVNYQGPVTDQSTTPGLFVATAAPRTLQLGAKLYF